MGIAEDYITISTQNGLTLSQSIFVEFTGKKEKTLLLLKTLQRLKESDLWKIHHQNLLCLLVSLFFL